MFNTLTSRWLCLLSSLCLCATVHGQDLGDPGFLATLKPAAAGGGSAPTFDSVSKVSGTAITTLFLIHTNSGGSNRGMVIMAAAGDTDFDLPTVTVDGSAATRLATNNAPAWVNCAIFGFVGTQSGTNHIVVTWASEVSQGCLGAVSFSGVHQTIGSAFSNVATNAGTSTAPSVTVSSSAASIVVSGVVTDSEASLSATTGTSRFTVLNVGTDTAYGMSTLAGEASTVMTWATASEYFAIDGISVNPP